MKADSVPVTIGKRAKFLHSVKGRTQGWQKELDINWLPL